MLLSTSYLDEAERCGHVVVLHQGKVLAREGPDEINRLAAGRVFLADHPLAERPGNFKRNCWIARISSMPCPKAATCVSFDPTTAVDASHAFRWSFNYRGRASVRGWLHAPLAPDWHPRDPPSR